MTQLVRAVNIVAKLIAWMPGQMTLLGWSLTVSDELTTANSMAIFRTGGPMRDMVTDSPTVVIECKAPTKERSYAMAADARALLHSLEGREVGGVAVQRVQEFSGPGHLPVADSPTRVTQTFSLDVSAEIIG